MTNYGTPNFKGFKDAINYYRAHGYDMSQTRAKIRRGEITIGRKPKVEDGHEAYLVREDGIDCQRWYIREA